MHTLHIHTYSNYRVRKHRPLGETRQGFDYCCIYALYHFSLYKQYSSVQSPFGFLLAIMWTFFGTLTLTLD